MSEEIICQIRCNECKTEGLGSTLKEAYANLKCKGYLGPNQNHRAAFVVDGKEMFKLEQVVKDDHKGKTNLSGNVERSKKSSKSNQDKKEKTEDKSKKADS